MSFVDAVLLFKSSFAITEIVVWEKIRAIWMMLRVNTEQSPYARVRLVNRIWILLEM